MLDELHHEMQQLQNKDKAKILQGFFKTGKGEYGEGDVFLGITVPQTRTVAKKFKNLPFEDVARLLDSKYHEERLCALLILVELFTNSNQTDQQRIVEFYLEHTTKVNNWDLVDLSADKILGVWLFDKDKSVLYSLANSKDLWERRIAIVCTFYFIKQGKFDDTIKISEMLLHDEHDLIHKAVGWMLREVGKKDQGVLEKFLEKYHKAMPRTMLRYAIEKLSVERRKYFMKK